MVAPIVAAKAAQSAGKALSGDIWSRTTFKELGKGKDKRLVESTVRVNTGAVLVGAVAAGVVAVGAGTTLFLMGLKLKPHEKAVDYYKWIWPDGTEVDGKVIELTKMGVAPKMQGTLHEEWLLPTGDAFTPYIIVSEGTPGAIYRVWYDDILAIKQFVETKTEVGFNISERPGLLSGVTDLASVPFDIALAPLKPAQDAIQDFKNWIGLP